MVSVATCHASDTHIIVRQAPGNIDPRGKLPIIKL